MRRSASASAEAARMLTWLLQDVQPPHRVPEFQIIPEFRGDVVETFLCPRPSSKILVHDHDIEWGRRTPAAREHF